MVLSIFSMTSSIVRGAKAAYFAARSACSFPTRNPKHFNISAGCCNHII
uniref:Uncharacterized protein n=1 Tax=Glossina morsitans morsitans TaxID=37546 RepID=A0ABK9NGB7_GLOMM